MTYTVVYTPDANDELADRWNHAADRNAISRASAEIDLALKYNPYATSESREGGYRVLFRPPLAVAFDVCDDDCLVTVWHVWEDE